MKLIIRILYLLLIILILLIITGLFLPKSVRIISIREISASPTVVFEQLNRFENWSEWSPWQKKDSLMVITLSNPSQGKGSVLSWKSSLFGNCKATMTHSVRPESIAVDFVFPTSNKTTSLWYIEPTDMGSRLNWTLNITKLQLFERYMALFYKQEMKEMLEQGMDNLKKVSEDSEKSRIGEVSLIELEVQPSVVLVDTLTLSQIIANRSKMIDYVSNFLVKRKLSSAGDPFGIYMSAINDSLIVYACGIPVHERTWVWQTLQYIELPATKAVVVSHFGGDDATKAFRAINKYTKEKNYTRNGAAIEKYLYKPKTDADTANWEIKVYMPVK